MTTSSVPRTARPVPPEPSEPGLYGAILRTALAWRLTHRNPLADMRREEAETFIRRMRKRDNEAAK